MPSVTCTPNTAAGARAEAAQKREQLLQNLTSLGIESPATPEEQRRTQAVLDIYAEASTAEDVITLATEEVADLDMLLRTMFMPPERRELTQLRRDTWQDLLCAD
jgi:hypothetical protein